MRVGGGEFGLCGGQHRLRSTRCENRALAFVLAGGGFHALHSIGAVTLVCERDFGLGHLGLQRADFRALRGHHGFSLTGVLSNEDVALFHPVSDCHWNFHHHGGEGRSDADVFIHAFHKAAGPDAFCERRAGWFRDEFRGGQGFAGGEDELNGGDCANDGDGEQYPEKCALHE